MCLVPESLLNNKVFQGKEVPPSCTSTRQEVVTRGVRKKISSHPLQPGVYPTSARAFGPSAAKK